MNGIKITGLTLKELLNEKKSFYTLYKYGVGYQYTLEEARKFAAGQIRNVLGGAIGEEKIIAGIDMYSRLQKEVERAKQVETLDITYDGIETLEIMGEADSFYWAEESSGNDAAIDKSKDYQLQNGDYYKCRNTGMSAVGEYVDLYFPLEKIE